MALLLADKLRPHLLAHHAFLLEGERHFLEPELINFLTGEFDIKTKANPDFWHRSFETLYIDEVRSLEQEIRRRPVLGERRFFLISANTIAHEAQNALLKTMEEPPEFATLFLILPNAELLLPTVRSRMFFISIENHSGKRDLTVLYDKSRAEEIDPEKFLQAPPAQRLQLVSAIINTKDKKAAINFIDALEMKYAHVIIQGTLPNKQAVNFLGELLRCRRYLSTRSPSLKLILEHICLATFRT